MTLSGNILLIDDDAAIRKTFTRILRNAGCQVTGIDDGREVMTYLQNSQYDLVYLDLHLPSLSGLEVLKLIQQQYNNLPVILFTGHATIQSSIEALRMGATDYLLKPVNPEMLLARTRVILAERAIQRRRQQIQAQIAQLQEELEQLDNQLTPSLPSSLESPSPEDRFLKRHHLILDQHTRRAVFGENILELPPTAFDYLLVLTRHSPNVVSYQTLVAEAQGYQAERRQAQELAKWHIHVLRNVLETDPQKPRHILNQRGIGYRLVLT